MVPWAVWFTVALLSCVLQVSGGGSGSFLQRSRRQFEPVSPRIGLALIGDDLNWGEAFQKCKSLNSTLAYPRSPDEGATLRKFLVNSLTNATKEIHLGFHSMFSADNYTTVQGYDTDKFGYLQWDPESDNGTEQRCGAMTVDGVKTIDCAFQQQSVCQFKGGLKFEKIADFGYYCFLDLNGVNWTHAIDICKMETANLLVLRSTEEYEAIVEFYTESGAVNGSLDIHYGAHRQFGDDFYLTIGDEPLEESGFNTWAPGEPADVPGADFPLVGLRLADPSLPEADSGMFLMPQGTPMIFICKRELHD